MSIVATETAIKALALWRGARAVRMAGNDAGRAQALATVEAIARTESLPSLRRCAATTFLSVSGQTTKEPGRIA